MDAVCATVENFAPYGRLENVLEGEVCSGPGWECRMTEDDCLPKPAYFGIVPISKPPGKITEFVRYTNSPTMLLCCDQPVALALANKLRPKSADLLLLLPGQVAVINEGVWRSGYFGLKDHSFVYELTIKSRQDLKMEQKNWEG